MSNPIKVGKHEKSWHGLDKNNIVIYEVLKNKNRKIYTLPNHVSCIVLEREQSFFSLCFPAFPFLQAFIPVKSTKTLYFLLRICMGSNIRDGLLNESDHFYTPVSTYDFGSMNPKTGDAQSLKHQKASLFRGHWPRESAQSSADVIWIRNEFLFWKLLGSECHCQSMIDAPTWCHTVYCTSGGYL